MRLVIIVCLLFALSPTSFLAQGFWENLKGPPHTQIQESNEANKYILLGEDTIYACLRDGVVMSIDEGATWERRTNGLPTDNLISLAADSAGSLIALSYYDGVFRSTDAGLFWVKINQGIETSVNGGYPFDIWDICYSQIDDSWFIASMNSTVHVSTDGGDRWKAITLDTTKNRFRAILCAKNGNIVVCGQFGIFTWIREKQEWLRTGEGAINMHRAFDRIYAVSTGFITSDDNGESWSTAHEGPENLYLQRIFDTGENSLFVCAENMFMMSYCFQSLDSGDTWKEIPRLSNEHVPIETMLRLPSGRMLAGDWYGLLRSDMFGENWMRVHEGVQRVPCKDVIRTTDRTILAATLYGLFSYQDTDRIWERLHDGGFFTVQEHIHGTIVGRAWPGVLRSPDDGSTWDNVILGYNQASCLLQNQNGVLYCGIVDSTIYHSFDAGDTWKAGTVILPYSSISDAVVDDDGTLLLLSDSQGVLRVDSALTESNVLLPISKTGIFFSIALHPQGAIVVSAWNGLFRSMDDGITWESIPLPDPGHSVPWHMNVDRNGTIFCLFRIYGDPQDYKTYIQTSLYASADQGLTWKIIDLPQPYQRYTLLEVLSDGKLYLGTETEGLFRSNETVSSISNPSYLPFDNSIRAYPQPASTSVYLVWEVQNGMLSLPQTRSLTIYNYLGRIVDRRDVSVTETKVQRIVYDTHLLHPGVYLFTLTSTRSFQSLRVLVQH